MKRDWKGFRKDIWAQLVLQIYRFKALLLFLVRFTLRALSLAPPSAPPKEGTRWPDWPAKLWELQLGAARCIACGVCNAGCASAEAQRLPAFFLTRVADGETERAPSAWLACFACEGCRLHCPYGVPLAEIAERLRQPSPAG